MGHCAYAYSIKSALRQKPVCLPLKRWGKYVLESKGQAKEVNVAAASTENERRLSYSGGRVNFRMSLHLELLSFIISKKRHGSIIGDDETIASPDKPEIAEAMER